MNDLGDRVVLHYPKVHDGKCIFFHILTKINRQEKTKFVHSRVRVGTVIVDCPGQRVPNAVHSLTDSPKLSQSSS